MKQPLPIQFERQNAESAVADEVFATTAEMNAYLSNASRYPGMLVTCLDQEGSLFMLNLNRTAWITTSGGIGDVTIDNKQYVRKNKAWVEAIIPAGLSIGTTSTTAMAGNTVIPESASDISYTNPTYPTVAAALDELLYIAPTITSFTGGSTNELGNSVIPTLKWAYNKAITEQRINGTIETLDNRTKTLEAITADASYVLSATDGTTATGNSTQSILFRNYRFMGRGTSYPANGTAAENRALMPTDTTNRVFQLVAAGSFIFKTGAANLYNEFWICLPSTLAITGILDTTNNSAVSVTSTVSYPINNGIGNSVAYTMHKIHNAAAYPDGEHSWTITISVV